MPGDWEDWSALYRASAPTPIFRALASAAATPTAADDDTIKLRGRTSRFSEIEAKLAEHPAVKENVVWVWEDSPGVKRLVAYLVVDKKSPPSLGELRTFLTERLQQQSVPT